MVFSPSHIIADGNCYYRAVGYAYIEKLLTLGPTYIKDFRERIFKKEGYYRCDDASTVSLLCGHLQQLHEKLLKEGPEKTLQLFFKMMIFSDHFDDVNLSSQLV